MAFRSRKEPAGSDRSELRLILSNLEQAVRFSSSLVGLVSPPLPAFLSVEEVKEFCVGLLNPCGPHPWRAWWDEQEETSRFSLAHSLFLFRKTLPGGSEASAIASFLETMTQPQTPADPEFLAFIRQEVPRLFRQGWDAGYRHQVSSLTPPTSSSLTTSRATGGVRGGRSSTSRAAPSAALGLSSTAPSPAKVAGVPDGGKWRVVTINGDQDLCLRPLHHLIYDHLSKKPWLLRGDAKSRRFRGFTHVPGEVFVSGDYASATDSIPLDIYHEMLKAVARTSTEVPTSLWAFALRSSVKEFVDCRGSSLGWQGRGQLMGSYLSFPFLCLLNYLCFRFSIRRRVPLRINGDDIVFRCTEEEREVWARNVARCGLILSAGKTLVHPRVFTLNSVMFRADVNAVRSVSFFRSKAFFTAPETASAIAGQLHALVVGRPGSKVKDEIQVAFLLRNQKKLAWSMMSLTRDLSARVSDKVLRMSGLYDRERFYLGLPPPPPARGPPLPGGFVRRPPGKGWRLRVQRQEEQVFFRYLSEMSWLGWQPTSVRRGTTRYRRFRRLNCRFLRGATGKAVYLGATGSSDVERGTIWCYPASKFVPGGIMG